MKSLVPALAVADVAASVQFYSEVLGFEVTFTFPGDDGKLVHASVRRGDSEFMFGRLRGDLHDQAPLGRGVSLLHDDWRQRGHRRLLRSRERDWRGDHPGADRSILG